ncbi:heparanase-like isoform X2 [Zootermopsis nevadensis]|uniref:heparanase-like isoform X2 n=1 Tax=Zootermopsis nevadensis TaxID=136037 RepID=UPI000B8E9A34|nr:heparanase-like isoform X2 [Zootermopsis nevadensis]
MVSSSDRSRKTVSTTPQRNTDKITGISYKAILMPFVFIISCFTVLVGLWQLMRRDVYVTHAVIQTDRLVHKTDQNFLSVALDTSHIQDGWVHKNIKSEVLLKMTVALAPAYLRVGGTMADRLIFQPECSYSPVKDKSNLVNTSYFNMTACDWIALNRFAHAAGLQLLFDLNVLLRNGTEWDSSNARLLLDFSDKLNFDISWQLGNEPNSFNHVFGTPLSGHQLGQDFVELRRLLNSYPRYNTSLLVGPDVTRPLIHQIGEQPIPYLKSFLARATGAISAITWHQYYLNGRKAKLKDFVSPDVLNILACQISALCSATTGVHLPLWLSETGSAYGGGAPGLSDRFVAGFLWLDKLGMAAHLGVDVVVRQSLCGGNYGLLGPEMEPLPDWWVSVLYKKLVGLGVLNVVRDDIIEVSCLGEQGHVRLYCHCANQRGAVTLFGVNVMNRESHVMVMGLPPSDSVLAYVLTADTILSSRYILLNGRKLSLKPDGSLPPFKPKFLNISKPLVMPAFSMVFWVIEDVHVPVCEDT